MVLQPKEDHDIRPPISKNGDLYWDLRTEMSFVLTTSGARVQVRCHPNYKNEGPWHDWVVVHFDIDPNEGFETVKDHTPQYRHNCVPCKVLAVMEDENKDHWILVHGCEFRHKWEQRVKDSVLLEHWELAYHNVAANLPMGRGRTFDGRRMPPAANNYWTPLLTWVKPENVVARCLVVEQEPGIFENAPRKKNGELKNKVILVRQRAKWTLMFTE